MKCELSLICGYVNETIATSELSKFNYISTENMLPNKNGIEPASSLPNQKVVKAFKKGDILISNIRPYFKKIWLAEYNGGCSNDVLVIRAKKGTNKEFLYYLLSENKFFDYVTASSKGTKMPRGDKNAIMNYLVPEFEEKEQRKIAKLLGTIDKKIKVNKKINDNLLKQAQILFKRWFIDNPDIALWKEGTFSELIERIIGGDWGKESPSGNHTEMVYCIRGADIPDVRNGNKGKMPTRYILPKNYDSKHLINGDIVVEISGGSPTQSTGRAAAISTALLNRYYKGMICTNFCKAIKPKVGYSMYVYHYWQYLYNKDIFFSYENGTTGIKNLDINGFIETEPISIAPASLVNKFDNFCQFVFSSVYANGLENEQLSLLRDTLLTKLISGEIDVSDIQL